MIINTKYFKRSFKIYKMNNNMNGYKIRYKDSNGIYVDYDQRIYITYETAEKIMEDAQEQFPNYIFEIYYFKS